MFINSPAGVWHPDNSFTYSGFNTNALINRVYSGNRGDAIQELIRSGTPSFTISVWVYVDNASPKAGIGGYEPSFFSIYDDLSGRDRCYYMHLIPTTNYFGVYGTRGSGLLTNYVKSDSEIKTGWTHVVHTYDSTQTTKTNISKLFINGVYDTLASSTGSTSTTNKFFVPAAHTAPTGYTTFGCDYANGSAIGQFSGKTAEASFWYGAMPDDKIAELYNNGLPTALTAHSWSTHLITWLRFGNDSHDNWDGTNFNVFDCGPGGTGGTVNMSSTAMTYSSLRLAIP